MTTFYITSAVVGGIFVVLQAFFGLFGDHDDFDHGHDALDIISLRTVAAGLTAFGLAGGTFHSLGVWWWVTLLIAGLVGFATMVGVAFTIRQIRRLESDGTPVLETAIGESGTVYLSIPANRSGRGKVTTVVQGRLVELEAVTAGRTLAVGEEIVVIDIDGSLAHVRSKNDLEGDLYASDAGGNS